MARAFWQLKVDGSVTSPPSLTRVEPSSARRDRLTRVAISGSGLTGALALGRLLSGLLYGVTPTDPATFAAVAILVAAVALVAAWLPARRAARTDPLRALRHE